MPEPNISHTVPSVAATTVLTVEQAAKFLQVYEGTVRRLAAKGAIPGWKMGQQWRFSREHLEAYLRGETKGE